MNTIISIKNMSFGYSKKLILEKLSFDVNKGDFISIAGPNGAGKTTLLNLLCRVLMPNEGSIDINGQPISTFAAKQLARQVSIVRQEFVPVFDFTVEQIVTMSRIPYTSLLGFQTQADSDYVTEAMKLTDTTQFAKRTLASLSSGERQRVFIARAFAQDTPVLLLDEPTSFLDLKHQVAIYDLLKKAQIEKDKTIIAATHDINLASQYADLALLLGTDNDYRYGSIKSVFSQEQIEKFFDTKIFSATVANQNFFLPLGKYAKDNREIS